VATIGALRDLKKSREEIRVHRGDAWRPGFESFTDLEDETSETFKIAKSREEIRTVHHRRTRGGDRSIRKFPERKSHQSGNRELGDRGFRGQEVQYISTFETPNP
jgi:hypothetical protein